MYDDDGGVFVIFFVIVLVIMFGVVGYGVWLDGQAIEKRCKQYPVGSIVEFTIVEDTSKGRVLGSVTYCGKDAVTVVTKTGRQFWPYDTIVRYQ